MAIPTMSFPARSDMLPNPTYTGGVPASRKSSNSAGSGRSSGSSHAPVWTTSSSAGSCHGASVGSAASHGCSVKAWVRTSCTGGRPIDARRPLSVWPKCTFVFWASWSHSSRLSIWPIENGQPEYDGGGWWGEGRWEGW